MPLPLQPDRKPTQQPGRAGAAAGGGAEGTGRPLVKPAASVAIVRDGPTGVETLMLRRPVGGAFGGMWVFPGGKVEAADLGTDEVDRARSAAVREAAEEAGFLLARERLAYLSHWLPPADVPHRFSTWFFVAAGDGRVTIDGREIDSYAWCRPREALSRCDSGDLTLVPPTWVTLHWLSQHADADAAVRAATQGPPESFVTRLATVGDIRVAMWQEDAGHRSGNPSQPGSRHRLTMAPGAWRYERARPRNVNIPLG